MNTKIVLGVAFAIALNCTTLNAQVLGGNAAGGLSGSLGGTIGGMRDLSVIGQGAGHGGFNSDLDTGSLRRTTSDVAGRTKSRVRDTTAATRERARSTVTSVSDTGTRSIATASELSASAASSARASVEPSAATLAETATATAANTGQIASTATAAGSLVSGMNADGGAVQGALDAAHEQRGSAAVPQPSLNQTTVTSLTGGGDAATRTGDVPVHLPPAAIPIAPQTSTATSQPSASLDSALTKDVDMQATTDGSRSPFAARGDASAGGSAAASKQGVAAKGSADGSGSAAIKK